jgi:hypothetical protein
MKRFTVRRILVPAAVAVALGTCAQAAVAADSLTPSSVDLTLAPGQSANINKTLHLDAAPPKADIEIAIDVTGSMATTIAQAKSDASALVSAVQGQIPDSHFAVVAFEDKTDGPKEYQLLEPMTASAAAVQAAINPLAADNGGDAPEGHNLVFHNSYSDPSIGFRADARKFVVVLSDAEPHGAGTFASLQPGCKDTTADPNGLSTPTELAGMKAAELTLFMVRQAASASSSLQCYQQIAAQAFTGGAGVDGGANLGPQIVALINSAVQSINKVELATVPASFSSWASFNPPSPYGPVTAPFNKAFVETITVPAGTPGGDYSFDVVATADGATRAREHVTVQVPVPKLSVNDVTVKEGNTGLAPATSATFTVSLDKPSPLPVTVKYATADGSATQPADYQQATGTLTFAPNQTTKTVTVNVVGDLVDEPNETFHLKLSAPTAATILDGDGLGKILDDDRSGAFTCRAAGLRLLGAELAVSNGPNSPCRDAGAAPLNVPLGLGTIKVGANLISTSTNQTPDDLVNTTPAAGDRAEADSKAAVVTLLAGLTSVKASVVTSHAEARCTGGAPVLSGSSVITSLTVNGAPVVIGTGEVKINVLLGVLHINSTVKTATGVTQRGIWFESTLLGSALDVVVSEAKAGVTGNPCV